MSQVNFKSSNRKECRGIVLAELYEEVGMELPKDPMAFSERVCNPCGRKIRNLHHLYEFVTGSINTICTPTKKVKKVESALLRLARVHSPEAKTESGKSRRSLMFVKDNTHPPARTSKNDSKQAEFQSALNISDFPHRGLQVKVVLMNPNGNVTVRIYEARKTKKTGK